MRAASVFASRVTRYQINRGKEAFFLLSGGHLALRLFFLPLPFMGEGWGEGLFFSFLPVGPAGSTEDRRRESKTEGVKPSAPEEREEGKKEEEEEKQDPHPGPLPQAGEGERIFWPFLAYASVCFVRRPWRTLQNDRNCSRSCLVAPFLCTLSSLFASPALAGEVAAQQTEGVFGLKQEEKAKQDPPPPHFVRHLPRKRRGGEKWGKHESSGMALVKGCRGGCNRGGVAW